MEDYYKTMELGWINYMINRTMDSVLRKDHTEEEWIQAREIIDTYTLETLQDNYWITIQNLQVQFPKTKENYSKITYAVMDYCKENNIELSDDSESGMLIHYWEFYTLEEKEQHEPHILALCKKIEDETR